MIQIVDINSHIEWQTVQIKISWLLQKPTDLDLHCLHKQDISAFSRTRVKLTTSYLLCNVSISDVKPPSQVVVKIAGEYLTFQCDTLNVTRLSSSLLSQLNHTACMRTGNCTVSVASKPCPDSARSKRSGSTNTPFSVEIKMDIDTADYSYTDLQNFFSKRIGKLLSTQLAFFINL